MALMVGAAWAVGGVGAVEPGGGGGGGAGGGVGGLRVVLPGVGDGQPPAPAEAMAAFRAVRGWVDGWSVEGGEGGEG
ncbi:MAG: hypothetical protein IOD15_00315, partial [Phycisphaerales bacterium]|nr:hypothetical protein [Phycisphaerales bacterium]